MFSRNLRCNWRVAADRFSGGNFAIAPAGILQEAGFQIPFSCTHGVCVCL